MSDPKPKRQLFDSRLKEQKDFWVKTLSRELDFSGLPLDHDRPASYQGKKDHVQLSFAIETQQELIRVTKGSTFLVYAFLMAALKVCLHKQNGARLIVVGSPASRKDNGAVQPSNLLAIVDEVDSQQTFREFLSKVRENLEQSYAHEEYQYDRLLDDLGVRKLEHKCELFDVALVSRDFHADMPEARNDLTITFANENEMVAGEIVYNANLFEKSSVERFAAQLATVTESGLRDLTTRVCDLSLLTVAEQTQLLRQFNDTSVPYPADSCIHQLFEEQAQLFPDVVAVAAESGSLTYSELNLRANQLARYLQTLGVRSEVPVAVCLERGPQMIVALLGILKAGGVYVPLDPSYPQQRLEFILADLNISLVLTQGRLADLLPPGVRVIDVDDEALLSEHEGEKNPAVAVDAQNLAYIMYTSGSTGRPKGVGVTHRGVVRLVKNNHYVNFSDEVFLQFAPLSFDASTFEIWGSLLNGSRLVLAPEGKLSLAEMGQVIEDSGVTTLWLTAGLFHQMIEEGAAGLQGVRQLVAGGDALSSNHVREAMAQLPQTRLVNGYGPTETTTFACCAELRETGAVGERVTIGRPIANTKVYILDERLRAVPVGVRGELYIGGAGVGRGYIGRAEQTAARFVPDPYSEVGGERLYATGDIASYTADGRIEFVGRRDGQVKVRGFRIETGEIEAVLCQHDGVLDSVVVARTDGSSEKALIAYLIKDRAAELSDDELRDFLQQRLPSYMLPSGFVTLDKLPLTANGKVDRAALPAPERMRPELNEEFVAPRTEVEKRVAEIWRQVLDLDRVGVNDNFFRLGGHSLLATRIATRLRESFQVDIKLGMMFEAPTVAEIAAAIEREETNPNIIGDLELERVPRGNEDLAQILSELAKLSDEEAQSLLLTESQQH